MTGSTVRFEGALALPWLEVAARGRVAIALVRHGRTAWNQERRFLGITDIPLDDVGEAQARALGSRVGPTFGRVYSSPLSRARATAAALATEVTVVDELHELQQGRLEGLSGEAALAAFPEFFASWIADPGRTRPPGGESLAECRDRAMAALERVARAHAPGDVVAVVTHQMVIASVTCTLVGEELTAWRSHGVGNTHVTVLAYDGERFEVAARRWELGEPAAA